MWLKISLMLYILFMNAAEYGVARQISYRGGLYYSSGTYFFDELTRSFQVSNGLTLSYNKLSVTATFPYLVQSSPWVSYSAGGGIPTGGTQSGEVRRAGYGSHIGSGSGRISRLTMKDTTSYRLSGFIDPVLTSGYRIFSGQQGKTFMYVNANLKIPISGPSVGFGTGAWDMGLGLSASQRIGASWMFFADVMHWWMGDMDELPLNNTLAYGVGIGKIFTGTKWIINGNYSGFTSIVENYPSPKNISLGTGYRHNDRLFLNTTAGMGLSETSPDFSFGLGWSLQI